MATATTRDSNWGGFQALRFVLEHALYVRDDQWIDEMIGHLDRHLDTQNGPNPDPSTDVNDRYIQWGIPRDSEHFADSAVEAVLCWLGCAENFRRWFINEMNDCSGKWMEREFADFQGIVDNYSNDEVQS